MQTVQLPTTDTSGLFHNVREFEMKFYQKHAKCVRRILSVIIPSRSLRYKVCGILKSDDTICRVVENNRAMCRKNAAFLKSEPCIPLLAICAIIKDEGPYLREWIEYHKLHGVDKIYIYDNESADDTVQILAPYIADGLVEYKYFPGKRMQLPAYRDCIKNHCNDVKWIMFIDLDEFVVPHKNKSLRGILNQQPKNVGQISMAWLRFGSNGHIRRPSGLVIENYTRRGRKITNCKSIVNPRVVKAPFVHVGDVANKTVFIRCKTLRVNHYYCKSWQEYQRRKHRGDALLGDKFARDTFNKSDFDRRDKNDIRDTDIFRYLPELKSAMAGKRK